MWILRPFNLLYKARVEYGYRFISYSLLNHLTLSQWSDRRADPDDNNSTLANQE